MHRLSRRGGDVEALIVFASRSEADRHMKKIGGKKVVCDPFTDFLNSTVPWAATRSLAIMLEPISGAGPVDVRASDFQARLAAA